MNLPKWENEAVTKYWLKHFVGKTGRCTLCDNTGIIEVTMEGRSKFHAMPCVCPNGQGVRHHAKKKK
jgi:excinuclease UvrABC ATPase subunit